MAMTFNVVLNCTLRKSTERKELHLPSLPSSVLGIKKQIEAQFSIPTCTQTLSYHSMILSDGDQIDPTHIRSGDTFHVSFHTKANCEDTKAVVKWMRHIVSALEKEDVSTTGDLSSEIQLLLRNGIINDLVRLLSLDLFYPWNNDEKYVNKLYFESIGGLETVTTMYSLILREQWENMPYRLKYMECACVQSLANFAQTFPLRRLVIKYRGLELCMKSLQRRKLVRGLPVLDESDSTGAHSEMLQAIIEIALYAVCNLSELPECQVPIAKSTDALNQALCISLSPSYTCKSSIVTASLYLCLAQSPEAHCYIAKSDIIAGLLDACRMREHLAESEAEQLAVLSLECYTAVILAQIALASPHLFPGDLLTQVVTIMEKILHTVPPSVVRKYEEQEGLLWGTFLPYIKLLYLPDTSRSDKLHVCSVNILVHALQNALGRPIHRDVLIKEGLLEYVICLPWHVPQLPRENAKAMIMELSGYIQLQPPSLCILAKAKLAKMNFGLEKLLSVSSVAEILQWDVIT